MQYSNYLVVTHNLVVRDLMIGRMQMKEFYNMKIQKSIKIDNIVSFSYRENRRIDTKLCQQIVEEKQNWIVVLTRVIEILSFQRTFF